MCFVKKCKEFELRPLRSILSSILVTLQKGLGHEGAHSRLQPVIAEIDKLTPVIAQMDSLGMPANFIVRLRGQQDQLRRSVFRIYHVQSMQFVPSVYVLVKTLIAAIVLLLLFLETEGSPGTALIFGFISCMFIYAIYLIETLEQPFRKDHDSLDDVSLFLLREFGEKLALCDAVDSATVSARSRSMNREKGWNENAGGIRDCAKSRDLDPQNWLRRANFFVLNLQSHVVNLEFLLQNGLGAFQHRGGLFHVGHDEMAGQRIRSGRDGPDMQIVNGSNARNLPQRLFEEWQIDLGRHSLHQNMDGLVQQLPCARYDEEADPGADDRVG